MSARRGRNMTVEMGAGPANRPPPGGGGLTVVGWVVRGAIMRAGGGGGDVPVNPLRRGAGLAAVFGTIESLGSDRLTLRVVCVVVEIAARRAPRANYPTQWPGSVTLDDGRTLP